MNRRLQALEQPRSDAQDEDEDDEPLQLDVDDNIVDEDLEALDVDLHRDLAPAPKKRTSFNAFKPGTRQPAPKPTPPATARNWWEIVKPGESMTEAAKLEEDRMKRSKIAHRIPGRVND